MSELVIGVTVSLGSMLIHLAATLLLVGFAEPLRAVLRRHTRLRLTLGLAAAYVVLLCAHLGEVALWGAVYDHLGLVTRHEDAFYSAFVNYTALGYGDSLQDTQTRLLGPFASANGIMMFGWSTALLVLVIQRHLPLTLMNRQE